MSRAPYPSNAPYPEIPRWRFWWKGGCGFIFKSKKSRWNNLQVVSRPYAWAYKMKRIGFTVLSTSGGLLIVIDLGRKRCISIHYTPRYHAGDPGTYRAK